MKILNHWHFGTYLLLSAFACFVTSQQLCQPPDRPMKGNYFPKEKKFQPGDKIIYNCTEGYTLMGKETSKCKSNGDWSNPTPFCEQKAKLRNPYSLDIRGRSSLNSKITDGDSNTCYSLSTGESLGMTLAKPSAVYAIRIFMETGTTKFEIRTGPVICATFNKFIETRQWVLIQCSKNDVIADSVKIQDKSDRGNNSTLCEIEVYVKEEDGCEFPPKIRISNGYFEVTRSTAKLVCEDGYRSENTRLVCERNSWIFTRLQCNEILCDPVLNMTRIPGSEWIFLDAVKKISAGTRRQLRCDSGYKKVGNPDIITCQKNGFWTKSNATCVEEETQKASTKTIIFGAVGILIVLIILALLGTTIYFVRRQRSREVVVVYKQPTEGSIVSGSEGDYASAYYESIQSNIPLPPSSARPTAQMLSEGYFTPLDSKNTLKKQPMPADIAFGYDLPYHPISS